MKFKINGRTWKIKEKTQDEIKEYMNNKEEDTTYFGITSRSKQEIWLWKNLHIEQKRQTLKHELMHCYFTCFITWNDKTFDEEIICDISSNSHDIIHEIVERYFKDEKRN